MTNGNTTIGTSLPHPPPVLYENVTTRLAEEGVGEGEGGSARTEFFSSVDKGEALLKPSHHCSFISHSPLRLRVSQSVPQGLQGSSLVSTPMAEQDTRLSVGPGTAARTGTTAV